MKTRWESPQGDPQETPQEAPRNEPTTGPETPHEKPPLARLALYARERVIYSACGSIGRLAALAHFSVAEDSQIGENAWFIARWAVQRAHLARKRIERLSND